jgi:hypothetical protein
LGAAVVHIDGAFFEPRLLAGYEDIIM